ncbi:MAG: hypothetical protein ACM359_16810 [Bacillota bacterium]
MFKHAKRIGTLGGISLLALVITGCATTKSQSPYALTGEQPQITGAQEIARWSDDKGRFHPEWRVGINRPPGYPKPIPQ